MNSRKFLMIYIAALERALDEDYNNTGYHVEPPFNFIDEEDIKEVEDFYNKNYDTYKNLFDLEAIYFDAKSHYQKYIVGIPISEYREKLISEIKRYKTPN